ncbi:MAG: RND transporter [Betaproteobacteria bacterium HGW-Betaproteobacteria-10]|nr:MAG: RND transporter [Betaproteobacteria bacterium HGW-Betaproteobacteria-10]
MLTKPAVAAIVAALTLSGCAIGPDYFRPTASLPTSYAEALPSASQSQTEAAWWTLFQDPILNDLVEQALSNNADTRLAIARVEQAAAVAREAGAAFFPEIDGTASSSNRQQSTKTASWSTNSSRQINSRSAALTTSYELDVWGRVRRANEAVQASLLASQYSRDAIRLTIAGLISNNYLSLRTYDAQLVITHESLASRQDSLNLVKRRVEAGLVSPLDLYQAEGALAAIQAQAANLRRLRAFSEHQIALLTGNPALKIAAGDLRQLPTPPIPRADLPSALIEARPDVRQAEANLIAANAGIGLAKAGYFPKFSLTGSLGSESKTLGDLLGAGANTWSLGIGLLVPILDFGRTTARVDQAKALNQQSLIIWENTLQTAFKEVRDALVSLRENSAAETAQNQRVDNAQKALKLSQQRYDAGYSSYLEVLDAQRTSNEAQLDMIATRQARLAASVDLFKAIGGGWQDSTKQ